MLKSSPSSTEQPVRSHEENRFLLGHTLPSPSPALELKQDSSISVEIHGRRSKMLPFAITTISLALVVLFCFTLKGTAIFTHSLDEASRAAQPVLFKNYDEPFSTKDPVRDLGVPELPRPKASQPSRVLKEFNGRPLPTNSWYQSLLMVDDQPQSVHRAYVIPYVVDAVGPIPGLRLHPNHVSASSSVVQLNVVENFGLTLGVSTKKQNFMDDYRFVATHLTDLGVTLRWVSEACRMLNNTLSLTAEYHQGFLVDDFLDSAWNAVWNDELQT